MKKPLGHTGLLLLIFGAAFFGAFLIRQLMEWGTGHTYFGFLAAGATLGAVGMVFIVRSRRQ